LLHFRTREKFVINLLYINRKIHLHQLKKKTRISQKINQIKLNANTERAKETNDDAAGITIVPARKLRVLRNPRLEIV